MSDNNATKPAGGPKTSWTDREVLVYLWALVEKSGAKFDYNNTPRPGNRTVIAGQRKIARLATDLKDDLVALRSGQSGVDEAKTTPAARKKNGASGGAGSGSTARKRKAADGEDGDDDADAAPLRIFKRKRGPRKNKGNKGAAVEAEGDAKADGEGEGEGDVGDEHELEVKAEPMEDVELGFDEAEANFEVDGW
ncbi:hypothetical protein N0V83_002157 [Neocucurbitaria cava]|uniref:Uncharacterized protein n=1 Tax=Neocucurbitaria cava TaxID=798079 RepID=A0A9W8YGY4_9PLEO|nr:hypothetical protein N0V83_002157 [Neocucurbitaria cava]